LIVARGFLVRDPKSMPRTRDAIRDGPVSRLREAIAPPFMVA